MKIFSGDRIGEFSRFTGSGKRYDKHRCFDSQYGLTQTQLDQDLISPSAAGEFIPALKLLRIAELGLETSLSRSLTAGLISLLQANLANQQCEIAEYSAQGIFWLQKLQDAVISIFD